MPTLRSIACGCALFATFSVGFASPPLQEASTAAIAKRCSPYVVRVEAGNKLGSGFIVETHSSLGRLVFTCYHVIAGEAKVRVRNSHGVDFTTDSAYSVDPESDLAVFVDRSNPFEDLIPAAKRPRGLAFGEYSTMPVGARLVVIGSPLGLDETVTEGIAEAKRWVGTGNPIQVLQLSAAVSHGSSGSPVLDGSGRVVGMVTSFLTEGQELNLALAGSALKSGMSPHVPLAMLGSRRDGRPVASSIWHPEEVRAWVRKASDIFDELKPRLESLQPSTWTSQGLPDSVEANFIHAIADKHTSMLGLLEGARRECGVALSEPTHPDDWFLIYDALNTLADYCSELAQDADSKSISSEVTYDVATTLQHLSTKAVQLMASPDVEAKLLAALGRDIKP